MRYFKNNKNEIYAIDKNQTHLIKTDWEEISIKEVEVLTAPTAEQLKQERIYELEKLLKSSDYKVLPDYDKPNEDIKTQRQTWREEIRKLNG
jgi:hypothetical protein